MAEVLADELDDYGDLDFDLPADGLGGLEAITYGEATVSSKPKFYNFKI